MSERWHVVDTFDSRVLEVCWTPRQAQRAQKRWHKAFVWDGGPNTTIRRVAIRDEENQ